MFKKMIGCVDRYGEETPETVPTENSLAYKNKTKRRIQYRCLSDGWSCILEKSKK
jgi:hypothetical protein